MNQPPSKLSANQAMRMRLGFDPAQFMAEQRAKGVEFTHNPKPRKRPVTKQRMKLVVEILTIAVQEDPQLLSDRDHQAALSHATKLVNKL